MKLPFLTLTCLFAFVLSKSTAFKDFVGDPLIFEEKSAEPLKDKEEFSRPNTNEDELAKSLMNEDKFVETVKDGEDMSESVHDEEEFAKQLKDDDEFEIPNKNEDRFVESLMNDDKLTESVENEEEFEEPLEDEGEFAKPLKDDVEFGIPNKKEDKFVESLTDGDNLAEYVKNMPKSVEDEDEFAEPNMNEDEYTESLKDEDDSEEYLEDEVESEEIAKYMDEFGSIVNKFNKGFESSSRKPIISSSSSRRKSRDGPVSSDDVNLYEATEKEKVHFVVLLRYTMACSKGIRAELHDFHYSCDYLENGEMVEQSYERTTPDMKLDGGKQRKSRKSVRRLYQSLTSFAREYSSKIIGKDNESLADARYICNDGGHRHDTTKVHSKVESFTTSNLSNGHIVKEDENKKEIKTEEHKELYATTLLKTKGSFPMKTSSPPKTPLIGPKTPSTPRIVKTPTTPRILKAISSPKTPKTPRILKTINSPKTPKTLRISKPLNSPKIPKTPKISKTINSPKTPKTPKLSKTPKSPKTLKTPKTPRTPKTAKSPKTPKSTKKDVSRSDTKRMNDLFRRKSLRSCSWTRTKSATLALNETFSSSPTSSRLESLPSPLNSVKTDDTPDDDVRKCPNCDTMLHFAASNGELDIVKFYVESNLYINQQNKHLNTGLHCAVYYGHEEIVEVLLEHDPGIDMQNIDGDTALHIAVTTSHHAIINMLIDKGADLNRQNNNGDAPIHLAAHKGCAQSVQTLIDNDAKLDIKNKTGNTPLHSSINVCSNPNIVLMILQAVNGKREDSPKPQSRDHLMDQMIENLMQVQSILWKHKSDTFEDIYVPSTWRYSLDLGEGKMNKKTILSKSVNGLLTRLKDSENRRIPYIVNMKNNLGDTALHRAVKYCPKVLTMVLNTTKVATKLRNRKGETALHIAVKISNLKCQRILIKKNKRLLDIADNRYNTPLHWAAEWGYCRSIMYLLPIDYKKDMQNYAGNTALHLAILNTHFCIVWYLIENNVNVGIPNLDGDYPLHCAVKTGNFEIFQLVMKRSQSVIDRRNHQGDTALLMAIKMHTNESSLSVINALIRQSADVNIQDNAGNTALHLSLSLKLDTLCYRLVSTHKIISNIQNKEGNTVLHLITKSNQIEMLHFLNAPNPQDFHIQNNNGNTPLSIAIRHEQLDMSMTLLSHTWKVDLATYTQLCS